ncbi:hypothetical protein MLD38_010656 [Melastoma candidum]|uniref:Uncharacterized protein n=1 Tax=Melastoma candidum TaxID=119954 RepID=A0ACB9R1U4_9MYRT|nr:hypothetical protein MLD38_010656 [Melastoma candidum]
MEGIAISDGRVGGLGSDGGVGVGVRGKGGMRFQNPFTFKVGQVFTGFGLGCGVGIGVGRPINMGAIPVVNQMLSATRGATDAFSGVTRHVNDSLKRVGAKNIEAGIGCGVGFGHGFGVGLALKPGVIHQIQSGLIQVGTKLMMKFGMSPDLTLGQSPFSSSLQSGMNMMNQTSNMTPLGNTMQLAPQFPRSNSQLLPQFGNMRLGLGESNASKDHMGDSPVASRTEKVINDFLQNPLLKREDPELDGLAGRLRSENNLLQMVLKHQQVIEELREQNQRLQQILAEELKVPPGKIRGGSNASWDNYPCADCFECRRKQRRR